MREITVPASLDSLDQIVDLISGYLICEYVFQRSRSSYTDKFEAQLIVAIQEIYSNIVKYAYRKNLDNEEMVETKDGTTAFGNVTVRVCALDDKATVELIDSGIAFNPFDELGDEIDNPFGANSYNLSEARRTISVGIYEAKQNVDEVKYERSDNQNHFILTKYYFTDNKQLYWD
jgi:anti-sigma regulatory factor (Ser/Thr protein kinase)